MNTVNTVTVRLCAIGVLVAALFGCASGMATEIVEPHADQACEQVSAGLFPIDPATVVDRDRIEAWLVDWASTLDDGASGGVHAVLSLRMVEDEVEEAGGDPAPPSPLDAFLTETTLDPEGAAALAEVVREARILDHPQGAIPDRLRLEVVRNPSGQMRFTPMVSTRCSPAVVDSRQLAIELNRPARGVPSTGATITATLFVDEGGRVRNLELTDATPGFQGGMALTEILTRTRYHPALLDGRPVPNWVTFPVRLAPLGR